MRTLTYTSTVLLVLFHWQALGQNASTPEQRGPQPLYQVTIVSRTTKALNYGYLSAPDAHRLQGHARSRGSARPSHRGAEARIDTVENAL